MSSAFYVSDGGGFVSTEITRGPWDGASQHAGPPAALIGREVERCPSPVAGERSWQVGRITYEILRPVPIAPLTVTARVERPGRSVELVSASLRSEEGEVIRALAWRVAVGEVELPAGLASEDSGSPARRGPAPPAPAAGSVEDFFPTGFEVGYHTAMEYRFTSGRFLDPGPAVVWMRMRHPLVEGEEPTPLQRVLIAADSGNGVSATLDWKRFLFINVDLTVHLHRLPATEWVCLDAITVPEPTGLGMSDTALHDERGPIGRAVQTLLIRERSTGA
ncbi:MAG TPA: thioesterase family protein [Solirubrobacterales bacterium]|nr:thioesterase family protein [Solirubrobacterales bacterium]